MNSNTKFYIELGKDAAAVLSEYYGEKVVKFIKDEPLADGEQSGSFYFGELKPYYDKYGYDTFNNALIYLYTLQNKKGDQDNE